jgi:argininosuccinate synthase
MECKHDMWVGAVWAWIFYTKSNICSGGKWHEWDSNNREDAIEYAKKHYIPMTTTKNPIYSCDKKTFSTLSHEVYCLSPINYGRPQ